MRILIINSVCGVGSTGKICQDLYWELKKQGNECKIAWGRGKEGNVPDEDTIRIGTVVDYWLHAFSCRIFDNSGFCSKKATKQFIKRVQEYDPEIIYLHNIHGYYINIEILFQYLRACGKEIFWVLHDCWSFTGHCAYMTFAKCNRWKFCCDFCPQKRIYPASYFMDRSRINFELKKKLFTNIPRLHIITPSHWLESLVKESFLQNYPVIVQKNKINTNIFKPTVSDVVDKFNISGYKIILCVANIWDERKGIEDVIRLASELDICKIVIIGVNKKQKNMIENSANNIICITKTNNQKELAAWYTVSDLLFNPTKEDNFPTVNLEAEACGTPVVTYDVGGCRETIEMTQSKAVKNFDEALMTIRELLWPNK